MYWRLIDIQKRVNKQTIMQKERQRHISNISHESDVETISVSHPKAVRKKTMEYLFDGHVLLINHK